MRIFDFQFWIFDLAAIRRGVEGVEGGVSYCDMNWLGPLPNFAVKLRFSSSHPSLSHSRNATRCRYSPLGSLTSVSEPVRSQMPSSVETARSSPRNSSRSQPQPGVWQRAKPMLRRPQSGQSKNSEITWSCICPVDRTLETSLQRGGIWKPPLPALSSEAKEREKFRGDVLPRVARSKLDLPPSQPLG